MAHELEIGADGKAKAFFVGQPAWHGLGTLLEHPPTVEEAIKLAGLDWEVELAKLTLPDGQEVSHKATVRSTDRRLLGVVGPAYVPLQNKDAFGWFQPLVDGKLADLEAAGSLFEGRKIWILAKVKGGDLDVLPGDQISQYLLLAHAHDGSLAIRVGFTTIRVVCNNTLTAAVADGGQGSKLLKVRHTSGAVVALDEIRRVLDLANAGFKHLGEGLQFLTRAKCDDDRLARYVREVFNPGSADDAEGSKRLVGQIAPLFEGGRGMNLPGVRGTMWAAYNALTEFLTHERGKSQDNRVDSQWFGDSAKLLDRALQVAINFAEGDEAGDSEG